MKHLRKMKTFLISLVPVYNSCILLIISCLPKVSNGVPDDYCLVPLNKSDCGEPPTPVFSYWLPGSRCEVEFWRGCPTINKFPSEFVCAHYCIGSLVEPWSNEVLPLKPQPYPEDNPCDEVFNDDDCHKEPAQVYTYNKTTGMCHQVTWRGCENRNRFEDEVDCIKVCQAEKFEEDLSKLNDQQIDDLNDLLDEAAHDGFMPEEESTTPTTATTTTDTITTADITTEQTADETTVEETETTTQKADTDGHVDDTATT